MPRFTVRFARAVTVFSFAILVYSGASAEVRTPGTHTPNRSQPEQAKERPEKPVTPPSPVQRLHRFLVWALEQLEPPHP